MKQYTEIFQIILMVCFLILLGWYAEKYPLPKWQPSYFCIDGIEYFHHEKATPGERPMVHYGADGLPVRCNK